MYERGFIDPAKGKQYYTLEGQRDQYGHRLVHTSIKHLVKALPDYINEETLLQYHGRMIGIVVDRTPKCHPEIAGEGIEYSWGMAKGFYRRLPIKDKRDKKKFVESVKKSLDNKKVLTIERQQKFSRRARRYMLAYKALDSDNGGVLPPGNKENDGKPPHTLELIEKLTAMQKKIYLCHRSMDDIETGYFRKMIDATMNVAVNVAVRNG